MPRRNRRIGTSVNPERLWKLQEELHKQWNRWRDAENKARAERKRQQEQAETERRFKQLERRLIRDR